MRHLENPRIASSWLQTIALILSFLLLGTFSLLAQKNLKDEELDKYLKILIDAQIESYDLTGISLAVQIPFEEPWMVASGFSNPVNNEVLLSDMAFNVASFTKTIIATMVFILAEQGILELDDPLSDWLPNYNYIDNSTTIRQLLSHTSGIDNYTAHSSFGITLANDLEKLWTPEELIDAFVKSTSLHPGERCEYSNTNYLLLGMILKEASGKDVSVLLKENIFEPLGMTNTCLPMEDSLPIYRVHGWEDLYGNGTLVDMSSAVQNSLWSMLSYCSGIFSDTFDMNTFLNALFVDGSLISQQSFNQMTTLAKATAKYGHGMEKYVSLEKTGWGHFGNNIGFSSAIFHFPEDGLNISLLINQRPVEEIEKILDEIMEITLQYLSTSTGPEIGTTVSSVMHQNYPNPFNNNTEIEFDLANNDVVSLKIFDTSGRLTRTLIDSENLATGHHFVNWNGENQNGEILTPGIYFYQMSTSQGIETKRCLKIK